MLHVHSICTWERIGRVTSAYYIENDYTIYVHRRMQCANEKFHDLRSLYYVAYYGTFSSSC
jgi:hypothetical protein